MLDEDRVAHGGTLPSAGDRGSGRDNGRVGFNPFRVQRRRTSDYVIVAAAAVVILALVIWAAW